MGAPVGNTGYKEAVYRAKAAGAVSRIDEVTRLLRFKSPAALHALTYYTRLQHQSSTTAWAHVLHARLGPDHALDSRV